MASGTLLSLVFLLPFWLHLLQLPLGSLSSTSPSCGGLPGLCALPLLSPLPTLASPPTLSHLHSHGTHISLTWHTQLPAPHLHLGVHHVQITNHPPPPPGLPSFWVPILEPSPPSYPVTQTSSLEAPLSSHAPSPLHSTTKSHQLYLLSHHESIHFSPAPPESTSPSNRCCWCLTQIRFTSAFAPQLL